MFFHELTGKLKIAFIFRLFIFSLEHVNDPITQTTSQILNLFKSNFIKPTDCVMIKLFTIFD